MAEIIKAGVIRDPELFALVERSTPEDLDHREALLRAIRVKQDIVEADPYEAGERMLLNLGHTFGHALEVCTGYARPHGVAVAQGMALAFRLACKLGMCGAGADERLRPVLDRWGLPWRWGEPGLEGREAVHQVYEAMLGDKKRRDGRLRLVLPDRIGSVRVVEGVEREAVVSALEELQ
jgi:3-dehydroquinate synthase